MAPQGSVCDDFSVCHCRLSSDPVSTSAVNFTWVPSSNSKTAGILKCKCHVSSGFPVPTGRATQALHSSKGKSGSSFWSGAAPSSFPRLLHSTGGVFTRPYPPFPFPSVMPFPCPFPFPHPFPSPFPLPQPLPLPPPFTAGGSGWVFGDSGDFSGWGPHFVSAHSLHSQNGCTQGRLALWHAKQMSDPHPVLDISHWFG